MKIRIKLPSLGYSSVKFGREETHKPRLYHVTALVRLKQIMKEGLSPGMETLSREVFKEEYMIEEEEEEEFVDCNTEAQMYLDEELGRGPAVYFWTDIDRAYESMEGLRDLNLKLIVLVVDPLKIPCTCYVSDAEIADEIYEEYYDACISETLVDTEKIERLVEEWEKTVEEYNPWKKYPSYYEVWCPCTVPPEAIVQVLDEARNDLTEVANKYRY